MAGGNSNKKNNSKKSSASKAPSTSGSPMSGTKTSTSSKGKQATTNESSPLSKATTQGRPPLPPVAQYREQDCLMPVANVVRVMRRILPSHAKISEEAKDTVQECVSEFISFITEEANEKCRREQRKTVTADDLIAAMSTLGFDDYVDPLLTYLHRYRQSEAVERGRVTQLPMRSQNVASPAITTIVAANTTTSSTVIATDTVAGTVTDDDLGFGLINNSCYDEFDVGSSSSNDGNLLQFGDHFDQLSPMVAPRPNASNTSVDQDRGDETYDPFAQFK